MSEVSAGGRSRASMMDVANAAGVSKAAVSKVIRNAYGVSPDMRIRVEKAIEALHYRPRIAARAMRGASFTMGLEIPQIGNDYFNQVASGAAERLAGSGYQLVIAPAMGDMKGASVINALVDRQVDGLIAISPEVAPEWLEQLGEEVPVVLLARHDDSVSYDTLTIDDVRAATLVMDHLLALGHRRILHLTVQPDPEVPAHLLPHTIRREVFERIMTARGLDPRVEATGPLEQAAFETCMQILRTPDRPTAIFASHDTHAIGAIRAREELGLTPADLSIVGADNIDLASNPMISLTTVDHVGTTMGRIAVDMLLERIGQERTVARHESIEPTLLTRGSSTVVPGDSR